MKIQIGKKEYIVEVANAEESREVGLSNRDSLDDNKGMLFIYEKEEDVAYWMKDTKIPLDIVFIDEDQEVICVKKGKPEDETLLECEDVKYVLEVNQNSGIRKGQKLILPNSDDILVLDSNGDVQMTLEGGERIFSIPNTKTLLKLSKKALESDSDKDYKRLGEKVFAYLEIQDTNEPQYV